MACTITRDRTARRLFETVVAMGLALGMTTQVNAGIQVSISDGSNTFVCSDTTTLFSGCAVTQGSVFDTNMVEITPSGANTGTVLDGPDNMGRLGDTDTDVKEIAASALSLGDWTNLQISASGATVGANNLNAIRTFTGESSGTADLWVMLTQFDQVAVSDSLDLEQTIGFASIGSLISGNPSLANVDFALYASTTNTEFGLDQLVYESTAISDAPGTQVNLEGTVDLSAISVGDSFSLTQVFHINHFPGGPSGKRTTTFGSETALPAPEPAILGLLGLGLVLTGLCRRRV